MNFIINIPEKYLSIDKSLYEMIADMAKDGVNGNSKIFSDYATNGDVIKTMFPNCEVITLADGMVSVKYKEHGCWVHYESDWWNTPYNNVEREG